MDIANTLKTHLLSAIKWLVSNRELLAKNPEKDFTRNRKFNAFTLIHYILSHTAESLPKDIYSYCRLNGIDSPPTKGAVIQQRSKLRDIALKALFDKFNSMCEDAETRYGYRIFAFDGTSINIARNPESSSYFEKQDFNQLLAVALYDVLNHTYMDFEIETKPKAYEVEIATRMLKRNSLHAKREDYVYQEICAKFVMFNFCQRITREAEATPNPCHKNQKKVNVTVAIDIARDFFRIIKDTSADILDRISRYIEAYRPGRRDTRKKIKPKSFIPFLYRVA